MKKVSLCLMAVAALMLCGCTSSSNKSESAEQDTLLIQEAEEVVDEVEEVVEEVEEVKEEAPVVKEEAPAKEEPKVDVAAWDKWLDSYEACVDSYIALSKKAQNGDLTAVGEYAAMLEKVHEMERNMPGKEDEMTPAQLKRHGKITAKLSSAAAKM
ncbi:MAG: hypothetical protein II551_07555 [Paludibacteraceae bacterium]|nr:hypothetical protein [Paludibacteraceae bacterium]